MNVFILVLGKNMFYGDWKP